MCGIVAAAARRDVCQILLSGLQALEYRGYDSAGLALLNDQQLLRHRTRGKVAALAELCAREPLRGGCGVAHTRWATHGAPTTDNAHPHVVAGHLAIVHNGIIENHAQLREQLKADGHQFTSQTDSEVVAWRIADYMQQGHDLLQALQRTLPELHGAYSLAVISTHEPGVIVGARQGSPLVLGIGFDENFLASDVYALLPVTNRFVQLEEGESVRVTMDSWQLYGPDQQPLERAPQTSSLSLTSTERGAYRHFMQKEIFEQPEAVARTLDGRLTATGLTPGLLGPQTESLLAKVRQVHIIACGTSYHAGLIARYQIEQQAGIPCMAEVASEYRYRQPVVPENTLFIAISQSGETADTLAALQQAQGAGYLASIAICNVPESSLVRAADLALMTRAGPEIGVASTKAFTTQLTVLQLLLLALLEARAAAADQRLELARQLRALPHRIAQALTLDKHIALLAERFTEKHHALFLGRGSHYPVAMEGALKLKEISYIHAEAYPAGELKHGPLALVDADMPVVAVAPNDQLLSKLQSNLEEVRARGGDLLVVADHHISKALAGHATVVEVETGGNGLAPIVLSIPLQLLAYHVAVLKGTDVDQPRNLAKSVTVE